MKLADLTSGNAGVPGMPKSPISQLECQIMRTFNGFANYNFRCDRSFMRHSLFLVAFIIMAWFLIDNERLTLTGE